MLRITAFVLLFALTGAAQQSNGVFVVTGATVIDGTGAPPRLANLLIEGDRIIAVSATLRPAAGVRTVDAKGLTLIPGLFDLHTHITASGASLNVAADWPKNLMAYLYSGVTSIADLGEYNENFDGIRALLSSGAVPSPHLAFASRFSTPGGHGAEGGRPDVHTREVLTPRQAHAAMAEVLRGSKPDLIKIFTDGWRYGSGKDMTSMDEDTIAAIVEDAHKAGIPVITHTVTAGRAKFAASAGADIIGHSVSDVDMDAGLLALLRSKGTYYVPTLAVYEPKAGRPTTPLLADVLDPVFPIPDGEGKPTAAQTQRFRILLENIKLAHDARISIASGTDAGMAQTYHGWATLRELKLLVRGGLTPLEAITAATGVSARALRVDKDRGTIAPGQRADFVLIAGRPDQRIDDIEKIRSVYFGGKEVDRDALKQRITAKSLSTLPASAAAEHIDDFERPDGRSPSGALWVNASDSGHDRSAALWSRGSRGGGNHTLLFQARMGEKEKPFVEMMLPLSAGGMLPVDASGFQGVTFDARGDGEYQLVIHTRGVRDSVWFTAPFQSADKWSTVRIPFSDLARKATRMPAAWTAADLLTVGFQISRPPGANAWLEIDNVAFYK